MGCKHNYIPVIREIQVRDRSYQRVYKGDLSSRDNTTLIQQEIYCLCVNCWDNKEIKKYEEQHLVSIQKNQW